MSAASLTFIPNALATQPNVQAGLDDLLVDKSQRGDISAFNQLVRKYQGLVYHTAYRVLGNGDDAADATQEAFASAYQNLHSFRGGSFKAWLLRIVTNACYDQLRIKQRRPSTSLDALVDDEEHPALKLSEAHEESPHEFAERQELNTVLQKGLATLQPDQRVALVLSDIDGFSYDQIAAITGTNMGTVKSRLSRARAHMRQYLQSSYLAERAAA